MADGGDNVFVYMGGEQVVPGDVTHVIIDRSVKIIPARAFRRRELLAYVETHDELERIGQLAFSNCISLREINLLGVREVEDAAFYFCSALTDVEFGNKLETIQEMAFEYCDSLQKIKMVSVRAIEEEAFDNCTQLTEAEFGGNLERIGSNAFYTCPNLRRIAIPLKDEIFPLDPTQHRCDQFDDCPSAISPARRGRKIALSLHNAPEHPTTKHKEKDYHNNKEVNTEYTPTAVQGEKEGPVSTLKDSGALTNVEEMDMLIKSTRAWLETQKAERKVRLEMQMAEWKALENIQIQMTETKVMDNTATAKAVSPRRKIEEGSNITQEKKLW